MSRRISSLFATPSVSAVVALVVAFVGFVTATSVLPAPLAAATTQDAASILETVAAKHAERVADVENYTLTKALEVTGNLMETPQYFVKMEVGGQPAFRLVPPHMYEREMLEKTGFPPPPPSAYQDMADAYREVGSVLEGGGGDAPPMPGAGAMMDNMAMFLEAGADESLYTDGSEEAQQQAADLAKFKEMARYEGIEPVPDQLEGSSTRDAHKLVVDGLELKQEADGGTFIMRSATMWFDAEHYVPVRMLVEGEVEDGKGKSMPLTIEKRELDYRQHGPLLVPRIELLRMSGIMEAMSEKDRKEMEKAKVELQKAKQQLDAMPDGREKEMIEKMLRPQIEKFEKMVEGDAFETTMTVTSVAVNEGPPTPYAVGSMTVGGKAAATYPKAMTMATEVDLLDDGILSAEVSIMARQGERYHASFSLIGAMEFPEAGGSIPITDASGSATDENAGVAIVDKGSGTITVTERTETRIKGTFTALLEGEWSPKNGESSSITFSVEGTFDSGAPAGPHKAPRGSPISQMFMDMGSSSTP